MQRNTSVRKPKIQNRFKGCVFITPALDSTLGKVLGFFTLVFGEHRERNQNIGEIRFGLRRGELLLDITDGHIDPTDIEFMKEFSLVTKIDATEEKSGSSSTTANIKNGMLAKQAIDPSIEASLETSTEQTMQKGSRRSRSFEMELHHVKANWSPRTPRWVFTCEPWEQYLQGLIDRRLFASITTTRCAIRYRFEIMPQDIVYTRAPFFFDAKTVNKSKIIHRLLTKFIFEDSMTLSRGEIESD